MTDYTLHIPAPALVLSKNNNLSRFQRAQIVRTWRHTTFRYAQSARLPQGLDKVRIDIEIRFGDRRHRDAANYHDTAKPIVDALGPELKYWRKRNGAKELVYAPGYGLIADDTPAHLDGPHIVIGDVLPRRPYRPAELVTVSITDLSGEA